MEEGPNHHLMGPPPSGVREIAPRVWYLIRLTSKWRYFEGEFTNSAAKWLNESTVYTAWDRIRTSVVPFQPRNQEGSLTEGKGKGDEPSQDILHIGYKEVFIS